MFVAITYCIKILVGISGGNNLSNVQNNIMNQWLQRPRHIEWEITLGLSGTRKPNVKGELITNLSYLDDQGEKWGDTYIKIIGQHYDDYAHWNSVSRLLPIGGSSLGKMFVPAPFSKRKLKGAAPGVTGLIGEVLVTVFLQSVLKLNPFDVAHLNDNRKAPDLCLDIEPGIISKLFITGNQVRPKKENILVANDIDKAVWNYPIPVECKSRRNNGDRQVRNAMLQLLEYWRQVPDMAGYGIYAQIEVNPITKIRLHLLAPKPLQITNVKKIITGNIVGTRLPSLPDEPTCSKFKSIIGGRLLG